MSFLKTGRRIYSAPIAVILSLAKNLLSAAKDPPFLCSVLMAFFTLTNISFAAEKIFIKEYTYQASEIDSKVTSRAQALEQAKRLVLEELGTYLMSKTEVKDFAISSDKVTVLTAGVVQTEIFDEKWNGERYYLKARIKADPDEVAKAVDRLRKDDVKTRELEESKRRANDALKEIEKLKAELETVKSDKAKQLAYVNKVNALSATDWFNKGYAFKNSEDYISAIDSYSKAIKIDPYYIEALIGRGYAYYEKVEYDKIAEEYKRWNLQELKQSNKAIAIKPDIAEDYDGRGNVFDDKGQLDKAIEDFSKAIARKPTLYNVHVYFAAYYGRGIAYEKKNQLDMAIEDFSEAIAIRPDSADYYLLAYYSRGKAYGNKGQYDRAIDDYNKAISLKPDFAEAYLNRGLAYGVKGQYDRSIDDFNRTISLMPDYAVAYVVRGIAYYKKNQNSKALADFKKACALGANDGCKQAKVMEAGR